MYAIDRETNALPPLRTETSLEVIVNVEAARATDG